MSIPLCDWNDVRVRNEIHWGKQTLIPASLFGPLMYSYCSTLSTILRPVLDPGSVAILGFDPPLNM